VSRAPSHPAPPSERRRLDVRGVVQGVGFRPFVYRTARDLGLTGWVRNDARGVRIEVEGAPEALGLFSLRLRRDGPVRAVLDEVDETTRTPEGDDSFEIRPSEQAGSPTAVVLADGAPCEDCLREMRDPADRRYQYPFINCTNCGPRFTIVTALPYDRPHTTMAGFRMCPACLSEYEDPLDRRFHAQPNACSACGPTVRLFDAADTTCAVGSAAVCAAAEVIRGGGILAFKGLGGFLLLCDARDEGAVQRLRTRKQREAKPLAVLVNDVAGARALCRVSPDAAARLTSPEAPILLLPRRADAALAPSVAPDIDTLGVMLPSSPLHHLLMAELDGPVIATSGNRSDEPICIEDNESRARLGTIADAFLGHDRPIARHVDDSVETIAAGAPTPVRRARGRAPLPIRLARPAPSILAVGGHLKNTVALSIERRVFLSQHIGDLDTVEARAAFERVIADFLEMYRARPAALAHDLHPDYASRHWVEGLARRTEPRWRELAELPRIAVQHHHAHLAACLAEHGHAGAALGVTWDGTGYGSDGSIWGGEFLLGDARHVRRVAHLRPFRLPGADAAVQEPRRVAAALLWSLEGAAAFDALPPSTFSPEERSVFTRLLETGFQAPLTTSMGRLFDGVAALLGGPPRVAYEGQAAMALEALCDPAEQGSYEMPLVEQADGTLQLDWRPLLVALRADTRRGVGAGTMAMRFHHTLVEALVAVAQRIAEPTVALSGGCFLNRWLLTGACRRLGEEGFHVLHHRDVPPGDGGISLGQVAVAAAALEGD
jgi:hydrogenase maturation protein HypF